MLTKNVLRNNTSEISPSDTGGKPEDLAAMLRTELAQRENLVKAAGIEPE